MSDANTKQLVKFNIKNAKYALMVDGTGEYVPLGYSDSISLEANYSEKSIYGDGKIIKILPNDKGKTGSLTLLNIDEAYEIAMKRRMKTASGTAEIKQYAAVEHALYFEFEYMEEDGDIKTGKTQLFGVTSGRPSETFNQTTEDVNPNNVSLSLTIKGTALMNSDGSKAYVDENGNAVHVWQETCLPGETGYEDYGKSYSAPKVPAAAESQQSSLKL